MRLCSGLNMHLCLSPADLVVLMRRRRRRRMEEGGREGGMRTCRAGVVVFCTQPKAGLLLNHAT